MHENEKENIAWTSESPVASTEKKKTFSIRVLGILDVSDSNL